MNDKVIAYPGDRPPMLANPPCSYEGAEWQYEDATPANAREAMEYHGRRWSDWGVDDELAALTAHKNTPE